MSHERPSQSAARRRPALVVMAACTFVLIGLGASYSGESDPRWLDRRALNVTRGWFPERPAAARAVIDLFDPSQLLVIVALLTATCLALGRRRLAILAVLGPGVTGVVTTLLKSLFDRTKNGDLAYPSGHMGAATALGLVAALLIVNLIEVRLRTATILVVAVTMLVAGGMTFALTVTNYHYLTDAIGGFCTAVTVVLGLALVIDRHPRRLTTNDTGGPG